MILRHDGRLTSDGTPTGPAESFRHCALTFKGLLKFFIDMILLLCKNTCWICCKLSPFTVLNFNALCLFSCNSVSTAVHMFVIVSHWRSVLSGPYSSLHCWNTYDLSKHFVLCKLYLMIQSDAKVKWVLLGYLSDPSLLQTCYSCTICPLLPAHYTRPHGKVGLMDADELPGALGIVCSVVLASSCPPRLCCGFGLLLMWIFLLKVVCWLVCTAC